jgi:hypothetical protein
MGKAFARCPECEKTEEVRWCDNCGCRLPYVAVSEGHGFGHYLDGHTYHFCSDECHDEWRAKKRPKKPADWKWNNRGEPVLLECAGGGCHFRIQSTEFVNLRPEDYTAEALDMGGCPKCGHFMRAVIE